MEDLISRREAATLAGVHINSIRNWERAGVLEVHKTAGGKVMVPKTQVEAIAIERHDRAATDPAREALEAENRLLRAELAACREDYRRLVDRLAERVGS
jgi:hypothetical protein